MSTSAPLASLRRRAEGLLAQERWQRWTGLGRRRVPPHVFALHGSRLLYARFGDEPLLPGLQEFWQRPLPEGLWTDGSLGGPPRDPAALAAVLGEVAGLSSVRPADASLVVPDAWLRLAFTELDELPSRAAERDEILRWKLKGLVPFRIEDLRIEAAPVRTPTGQEQRRVLIGFGLDRLFDQLEECFAGAGIRIGQLLSSGLGLASLASALGRSDGITALAYVGAQGYGLVFTYGDDLLFHRSKARGDGDSAMQIRRDLLLTRTFLEENFPQLDLADLLLLAEGEDALRWEEWLADAFGRPSRPLEAPASGGLTAPSAPWQDVAPMLGAAVGEFW